MTVLVTGGTGFVGKNIIARLKSAGQNVRALVRPDSAKKSQLNDVQIALGNIWEADTIDKNAFYNVEYVVHLVGIIQNYKENTFERVHIQGTKNMVDLAARYGVKKFVHMSALGARSDGKSEYHKTKWQAEEYLRDSGLTYTIFRPSIIFGDDCEFIRQMLGLVRKPLVTPVAGLGQNKMQPIDVNNVASFFAQALSNAQSDNKAFDLGGPKCYTLDEIMDILAVSYRGKRKLKMHIPTYLMVPPVFLMEMVLPRPPVTRDQLKMLKEDNTCNTRTALETFSDITLTDFDLWCKDNIKKYLN